MSISLLTVPAISRRMATDSGGVRGPQSSRSDVRRNDRRHRDDDREPGRDRERDRERDRGNRRDGLGDPNQNAAGPPVPGFGFNFANVSSLFPQGFPVVNSAPPPNQSRE